MDFMQPQSQSQSSSEGWFLMSKDLLRSTCENVRRLEAEVLMIYFFSSEADGFFWEWSKMSPISIPPAWIHFNYSLCKGRLPPNFFIPKLWYISLFHAILQSNQISLSPNGCKVFDLLFLITLGSLQRTAGPHAWNCAQPFVLLPLLGIAGMRNFKPYNWVVLMILLKTPKLRINRKKWHRKNR